MWVGLHVMTQSVCRAGFDEGLPFVMYRAYPFLVSTDAEKFAIKTSLIAIQFAVVLGGISWQRW